MPINVPEYRLSPPVLGIDTTRVLWVLAFAFYGVGDLATTAVGLQFEPVEEIGPLAALVFYQYGLAALPVLKLATFAVSFVLWKILHRPHRVGVPLGLAVVGLSVTTWNSAILIVVNT